MRFDNAFLCKSGHVGMQFRNRQGAIISVFHDGKELKVSEDTPPLIQAEIMRKYNLLHKRFKSN